MRRRYALLPALVALVIAGCGGSSKSSSSVSPAAYVKSICSAIAPFEKDIRARSSALNLSTIKNPQQGKTALHSFLTAVAGDADQAVSQLKSAGVPKVSNGKAIADGIVNAFATLKGALAQAADRANTLPTNNATAFKSAAEALGNGVRGSMSGISSSLGSLKSQDLESAAAKEPACKALASA
jgi:hypothetical protein